MDRFEQFVRNVIEREGDVYESFCRALSDAGGPSRRINEDVDDYFVRVGKWIDEGTKSKYATHR